MTRAFLLPSVLLCVAVLLSAGAAEARRSAKKAPTWVVIAVSEGDVDEAWPTALREAAEGTKTSRTWVKSPAISREEMQTTLSCPSWGHVCAGQAANLLGAENALLISLSSEATGIVVRIEGLGVDGSIVGDPERVVVDNTDGGLAIAKAWVAGAILGARPTVLVLSADLPGTEVKIDSTTRGVTPLTIVSDVDAGEHLLVFSREGKAPLARTIVVQPGTVNREHGVLASGGPPMTAPPTIGQTAEPLPTIEGDAPVMAIAGFSLAGVGAAGAVGGLLFAAQRNAAEAAVIETKSVDGSDQRVIRKGICDLGNSSYGACAAGQTPLNTEERNAQLDDISAFADTMNIQFQIGLWTSAAALAVAAGGLAVGILGLPGESQDEAASTASVTSGAPAVMVTSTPTPTPAPAPSSSTSTTMASH